MTDNNSLNDNPLTVAKKISPFRAVLASEILLSGIILLLCGFGVIPISVEDMWQPAFWVFLGVLCLTTGIMKRSVVVYWCAFPFFVIGTVIILHRALPLSYLQLYPIFIAIPAIASLFTLPFVKSRISHVKTIVFFGGISIVFLLDVVGGQSWAIIVPILLIIAGSYLLLNALLSPQNDWEEFDFSFDYKFDYPKFKKENGENTNKNDKNS